MLVMPTQLGGLLGSRETIQCLTLRTTMFWTEAIRIIAYSVVLRRLIPVLYTSVRLPMHGTVAMPFSTSILRLCSLTVLGLSSSVAGSETLIVSPFSLLQCNVLRLISVLIPGFCAPRFSSRGATLFFFSCVHLIG